ncbi:MAG: hypothetical protein CSYNP_04183 [Syntrophus sp. SKADARSKE-3]|nr:hypothetical protein [Syntrophus sp. SKADARSKE-3]
MNGEPYPSTSWLTIRTGFPYPSSSSLRTLSGSSRANIQSEQDCDPRAIVQQAVGPFRVGAMHRQRCACRAGKLTDPLFFICIQRPIADQKGKGLPPHLADLGLTADRLSAIGSRKIEIPYHPLLSKSEQNFNSNIPQGSLLVNTCSFNSS